MRRLALIVTAIVAAGPAQAQSTLAAKTLTETKAASVFIRVEKDKIASASGSGFLIRADGETGYIVTNHHVVHLTVQVERRVPSFLGAPPRMQPPRIGPRFPPIRPNPFPPRIPNPFPPGIEYRTEIVEVAVPVPDITVVFGSGTRQERSARAAVVAADVEADLAIVKVTGLKDLPAPIALRPPELSETMPIYLFGFPFGKSLALDKGNPAITVGRAAVSSIRTARNGDLEVIQFDGSVNPGNSGGPVIDEKGQLVGVVVAKVRNTSIGMAIPAQHVQRLLAGRVAQPQLVPQKADKGMVEVKAEAGLMDPLDQVKSVILYYAPASAVTAEAKKDGLAKMPGSKKVELRREGQKAVGTFSLAVPDKAALDLTCQVAYVNADGKTVLGELKLGAIRVPGTQPVARVPDPAPQPEVPFDAAALSAKLKPSRAGDRGQLVGVSLTPLNRSKTLLANELDAVIADLQTADKAHQAIKRLHKTEPDPKRQAEVARLLEKWMGQKDWAIFGRADAAAALRWWGTPESVEPLTALLSDPNVHVLHARGPALWTLGYLGGDKAIAAIAGRIENRLDRGGSVLILQQLGSVAEPQAIALLESQHADVRLAAAAILKGVGTKACAAALFKAAEQEKDSSLRKAAREALQAIAARQEKQ